MTAPVVSILCPTRGRPERCARMIESAFDTAGADIEVRLYVDDDDPRKADYLLYDGKGSPTGLFERGWVVLGPSLGVGKAWNILAKDARGDALMMGNDDFIYETQDWAKALQAPSLPSDGVFCAHFNDGGPQNGRCRVPIVGRAWYEALGYFTSEEFNFFYHDTWIEDLANRIGRRYYDGDIMVRHEHATRGGEVDDTHNRNRDNGQAQKDKVIWAETEQQREMSAGLLKAAIRNKETSAP